MATATTPKIGLEIAQSLASYIKGKTVLITGASMGGIGAECASTLVKFDPALVILTARSQSKMDETLESIKKETPGAPLKSLIVDISSLASVRKAAAEVNSWPETIDVLIHNAGVAGVPLTHTEDGLELTSATNHFGPFLFTKLLLPKMFTAPQPPRIVVVGSGAHKMGKGINWDDPHYNNPESYSPGVYPASKTYNHLFAAALARKSGGKVHAFSLSPGWIYTGLSRHLSAEQKQRMGFTDETGRIRSEAMATLQNGVAPYIVTSFDPELPKTYNGGYVDDHAEKKPDGLADFAQGVELEDRMWALSEQVIGEKFEF